MAEDKQKRSVKCRQCGGNMELLTTRKHTGIWPIILMILGVFCILFIGGAVLGIPLLLIGIYQYTARQTISYCSECGYHFKVWKIEKD